MKKKLSLLLSAVVVLVVACSKDKLSLEANSVTINNQSYPSVKIGTQTWTTVNYNGEGGENYKEGLNDISLGKLYTNRELKNLNNLPNGWRIPTENDVNQLMDFVGSTTKESGKFIFGTNCQKLMSTTGWANTLTNTNSTGLNLMPAGHSRISSYSTQSIYEDKGVGATFWTSSSKQVEIGYVDGQAIFSSHPLYFEIYSHLYNKEITITGRLRSAPQSGPDSFSHTIRFVKDN